MSTNGGTGVRSLRAMFENKSGDQSQSPPSRGRSLSGSVASQASRPVSKVRTSFIAVERPGDSIQAPHWGKRKASDVSSVAETREEEAKNRLGATHETVTTDASAMSSHTAEHPFKGGLGAILKGSSFEGTPQEEHSAKSTVSDTNHPTSAEGAEQSTPNVAVSREAAIVEKMKSSEKPARPPVSKLKIKPTTQPVKTPPKQSPAQRKSLSPQHTKPSRAPTSPAALKLNIKGGPAKIKGVIDSAKRAAEAREVAATKDVAAPLPKTPKSATSQKSAKPQPAKAAAPTTASQGHGMISEKVRQPVASKARAKAQPAKLPSVVNASTAASNAHLKAALSKPTEARPSPASKRVPSDATAKAIPSVTRLEHNASRKNSRLSTASEGRPVSRVPSAVTAETASTIAKKSSRASLATSGDPPRSRISSTTRPTDASFLTRMARPTAASAAKTHDKIEIKSPSRTTARVGKTTSKPSRNSDQSQATTLDVHEEQGESVEPPQIDAELPVKVTLVAQPEINGVAHEAPTGSQARVGAS